MRPIIYPYKMGSSGARKLALELSRRNHRAKRVRRDGNYIPCRNHLIINWGNSTHPNWYGRLANTTEIVDTSVRWLNHPLAVESASNKLKTFRIMEREGVQIPEFTTSHEEANNWGCKFLGRKKLNGHSGEGILIFDPEYPQQEGGLYPAPDNDNPFTQDACPLYVKYIKKKNEYRVHVFNGQVTDVQQKRKIQVVNTEDVDYQVRNLHNGWVYCRNDITPHQSVLSYALDAVNSLGLDFGAVDVIWNSHYEQAYVLEINCAPGLEGTTLTNYADAIESLL